MFRSTLLLLCFAVSTLAAENEKLIGKRVQPFSLKGYNGVPWKLESQKATVVVFLGTECPLVKLYAPRLEKLAQAYKSKGVEVVGINSNSHDSLLEMTAHARRQKLTFPILKDVGNKIADQMGATRTPEAFLLDENLVIRYHGRIDDQYGINYVRDKPRRQDLKQALDALLAGEEIETATTELAGCLIGRVRKPQPNSEVTYANQISRILKKRCVECHRKGEIGPFALTDYDEVVGWAGMIGEVVEANRMPPWHASPKHGSFANDRSLSDEEKKLISNWIAAGAPFGDKAQLPKPTQYAGGKWQLPRKPDAVVKVQSKPFRVPATGVVRYKYYLVNPGFKEDKWVSAAQLRPGNRQVVHHILAFAVSPEERMVGGVRGFLFGYVPGLRVDPIQPHMAKRIPAGSRILFQVHYTPVGTPQYDQSELGLVFHDKPNEITREVKTVSAAKTSLRIPPNEANYQATAASPHREEGVELLGFSPHMHLRGKSFRYDVRINGESKTVLDVPNYDFNWQTSYILNEPIRLPPGSAIACRAVFDNSEENLNNPDPGQTVRWGDQTWDEMMIGYYHISLPVDVKALAVEGAAKYARTERQLDTLFGQLDKDGDGEIAYNEVPSLLRRYAGRFDRDRSRKLDRDEMFLALPSLQSVIKQLEKSAKKDQGD